MVHPLSSPPQIRRPPQPAKKFFSNPSAWPMREAMPGNRRTGASGIDFDALGGSIHVATS
jgi:hypothetical protein